MDGTHPHGTRGYKSVFIRWVPPGDPTADFYGGGYPGGGPAPCARAASPGIVPAPEIGGIGYVGDQSYLALTIGYELIAVSGA